MEEDKIAYMMLTIGVIVSFSLFTLSIIFSELGYGNWLILGGVIALSLAPLGTILALFFNYILRGDYKWSLLCAVILFVVFLSVITIHLFG